MAKDVIITPSDGDIQFENSSGTEAGKIEQSGDDLVLSNAVGDILIGDGTADVYIGDGAANVDIVFEQNGSIRGEAGSSVDITLGSSDTDVIISGSTFNIDPDATFSGTINAGAITSTGTGEFEGNVIINTPSSNNNGQGLTINRPAAGTNYASVEFATDGTVDWSVGTNSTDAFEIYENGSASATRFSIAEGGNATFAGTIGSGAITSTGKISGTELEGTSLDINGNADISGNLSGVDTLTATTLSVTNYGLVSGDIPNNAANTSGNAATATTAGKLTENNTIVFGASNVQWTDQSSGGTGLNGVAPRNPTTGWYHSLIFNHANNGGYYSQISTGLNTSDIWFSRVQNGTAYAWQRIFADDYHPNADTLTTARTIGGVSFNGSANIDLPGVNTAGDQNTSGTAATVTSIGNLTGHITSVNRVTSLGSFTTAELNAAISDGTINSQDLSGLLPLTAGSGKRVTGDLYISDKLYMRPSATYGDGYKVMHVTGTGNAPYPTILNFNNYAKSSVMVINDEDVGIGETSPDAKLHIVDSTQFASGQASVEVLKLQRKNTGGDIKATTEGHISMWATDSNNDTEWGRISWVNDNAADGGLETEGAMSFWTSREGTLTRAMYIDHDQKVGIGTTSPDEKLHVEGSGIFGENANGRVVVSDDWMGGELGIMTEDEQTIGVIYPSQDRYSYGGNYGSEPLNIDSNSGDVGIGTTSPSSPLEVYGSGSTVLDIQGSQGQLFSITDDLSGDLFTVSDISGVPIFNVNATGLATVDGEMSIGLNGATPVFTLDVGGDIGTDRYIRHNGDSNTYFGFSGADTIQFNTNSGERLRIDSAGDITFKGDLLIGNTAQDPKDIIISQIGASLTEDTALMLDGNGVVVVRNLGSNAFNSTTIPGGHAGLYLPIGGGTLTGDLHISNNAAPADDLTLLTLQNGNSTGDIATPNTFIDFEFKDANTNVVPQARIGAHAGDGGDSDNQVKEGKGYLTFHTSDTSASSGTLAPPERVRIAHNGNVGIGTTTPSHKLEIGLTASVGLTAQPAVPLLVSNDGQNVDGRVLIEVKNDVVNGASAIGAGIKMTAANVTSLPATYDSSLIFLQSKSPGNQTIHSAPQNIKFYVDNDGTTAGEGTGYNSFGDLAFELQTDGEAIFNYNVGIGTTAPSSMLEIYRNSSTYVANFADTATRASLKLRSSSNGDGQITFSQGASSSSIIQTSNTLATTPRNLHLNPFGGNVSIGTATPSSTKKLDVAGNIQTEIIEYKKPDALNQFRGEVVTFGSQSGIAQGDVVVLNTSGQWVKAKADSGTTSKNLLGVAMGTTAAAGILVRGFVRCTATFTTSLNAGTPFYLSATTGGDATGTIPSTTGHIARILGYSTGVSAEMYFCPDNTFVEIA